MSFIRRLASYHVRLERPVDGTWQFFITDAIFREGSPAAAARQLLALKEEPFAPPTDN